MMAQTMHAKSKRPATAAAMIRIIDVDDRPELLFSEVVALVIGVADGDALAKDSIAGESSAYCINDEGISRFSPPLAPAELPIEVILSPERVDAMYCFRVMFSEAVSLEETSAAAALS